MNQEKADALREAADVLIELSRNPARRDHEMTHLAVTAADLRRTAERIEDGSWTP